MPRRSAVRRFRYLLEAGLVYGVMGLMRLIPLTVASGVGGFVGRTLGPLLPVNRRARDNIRLAFPDASEAEKRRILRGMWDNLGRVVGESVHIRKLWDPGLNAAVHEIGTDRLFEARAAGENITVKSDRIEIRGVQNFLDFLVAEGPMIIFTAHMGNWELLPVGASRFGVFTSVVFRTPNNPYVARLVERLRQGMVALLPKGFEGAAAAGRVMREGGRLGLLIDQKQNRGIPVDFFGRPAMTGTTLAKLALRFDCPVHGAWIQRLSGRRFAVTVTPPLSIEKTGDEAEDIRRTMAAVNETVESWIRERPDQWLWLHRRWPESRSPKTAA
jgi:KDO2-lipid IV(A) lauroyltransferase